MRSRTLAFFMMTALFTGPLLAYNKAGFITGSVIGGAGLISMIVSGAIMGSASDVPYCPPGTEEDISGTYDCSSQDGNNPQTCNRYACKDLITNQFQGYSHRKDQPRYNHSKWALVASAGVTGLGGLIALISGLACGGCRDEIIP